MPSIATIATAAASVQRINGFRTSHCRLLTPHAPGAREVAPRADAEQHGTEAEPGLPQAHRPQLEASLRQDVPRLDDAPDRAKDEECRAGACAEHEEAKGHEPAPRLRER